jgi:hypothetical protein
MAKDEEIKKLEAERDHLREWLFRQSSAQEIAPDVQKKLEQVEWQLKALRDSPEEAEEIPSPNLINDIERDYTVTIKTLPLIPPYNRLEFSTLGSTGTASSASVFEYVSRIGDIETPAAQGYSRDFTASYFDLQASQDKPNDVRKLLSTLNNSQTLGRFEEAYKNSYGFKSGVVEKTTAANSIRNFMEGVKGDLFEKARTWPKENMTWETMNKRLAKTVTGEEERMLLEQGEKRSSLLDRLADVLKDREGSSVTNLEYIWAEVLDHVFIVLSLIDQNKFN